MMIADSEAFLRMISRSQQADKWDNRNRKEQRLLSTHFLFTSQLSLLFQFQPTKLDPPLPFLEFDCSQLSSPSRDLFKSSYQYWCSPVQFNSSPRNPFSPRSRLEGPLKSVNMSRGHLLLPLLIITMWDLVSAQKSSDVNFSDGSEGEISELIPLPEWPPEWRIGVVSQSVFAKDLSEYVASGN